MHRGADDGAVIEAGHMFFNFFRLPAWLGKSDVEERLGGLFLKRSRGIHRSERQSTGKRRRLLHYGWNRGRNGDDLLLLDELLQPAQGVAEGLQQLVGGGMVFALLGQYFFGL